MYTSNCLLRLFNQYSLTYTTQILLSNLTLQELQHLLQAIQNRQEFESLTQLVRGRIIISISEQSDRTIYYTHFEYLSMPKFIEQRSNQVSGTILKKQLKNILESFNSIVTDGQALFQQEFQSVKQALLQPSLPLPPVRRQNVGPCCQTAFQIQLAMQQLYEQPLCEQNCFSNQKTTEFFLECLNFQIDLAFICISSIQDEIEHFAQMTYRFMIYRNTVLALHALCPFPQLTQTMKLWNNKMLQQYEKSHLVFQKLIFNQKFHQSGLLSAEQIKQQGYMVDYIEGLIDQSVNERDVTFCGHSKQKFRGEYARLENILYNWIAEQSKQIFSSLQQSEIKNLLEIWEQFGLKPSTLFQIIQIFNSFQDKRICTYTDCCRQDFFIENCARINGQTLSDLANIHLQCS